MHQNRRILMHFVESYFLIINIHIKFYISTKLCSHALLLMPDMSNNKNNSLLIISLA